VHSSSFSIRWNGARNAPTNGSSPCYSRSVNRYSSSIRSKSFSLRPSSVFSFVVPTTTKHSTSTIRSRARYCRTKVHSTVICTRSTTMPVSKVAAVPIGRLDVRCFVRVDIARQRRARLFNLRPIDSNQMSRAREQRLREIRMGEIIREIVIYICFTTVLLFLSYQARDTHSYSLYRDTKNLFINENFHDVSSISTWWSYCDDVLLKGLYAQTWYNNRSLTWREKLTTGSRASMRVGAPRIRQLRVKDHSCRVHRRVKHVIKHCRDDYNWIDDDTKDYTPRWEKRLNSSSKKLFDRSTNASSRCKTPWCYQVSCSLVVR
jgi:hypothetical protein